MLYVQEDYFHSILSITHYIKLYKLHGHTVLILESRRRTRTAFVVAIGAVNVDRRCPFLFCLPVPGAGMRIRHFFPRIRIRLS